MTRALILALCALAALAAAGQTAPQLVSRGLTGYISMEVPAPPEGYGYGVSLYAAAWPLVERPIRDFQIGLASIWIVPDNRSVNEPLLPTGTVARDNWPERGPSYRDVFQTIEGGLGFWASTRFGSTTAKFRMNGTANGYNHEISSPGWPFGGTTALEPDQMGIAQLSPRLLVPPDGLTFRAGTCGELLGYAWMALPLIPATATTAGLPIPTGSQSWTMFVNARNFRGPVAFYTPATWSRISRRHPPAVGRGLDALPGLVTGGAIEVNTVPRFTARDSAGVEYARIPRLQFPADARGQTVLIHDLTHYSRQALWQPVESWLAGGAPASGRFDARGARVPPCRAHPLQVRQGDENLPITGADARVQTCAIDRSTFGLQWAAGALEHWVGGFRRGVFPEYTRRDGREMKVVASGEIPAGTGLAAAAFPGAATDEAYRSPEAPGSVWRKPGPASGPFRAHLTDGSVVTYCWYRFIDQPALQDADLSAAAKARLQALAEQIHRTWDSRREYMAPPRMGRLAELDPALIVKPPRGLEVGYVPVVTGQAAR